MGWYITDRSLSLTVDSKSLGMQAFEIQASFISTLGFNVKASGKEGDSCLPTLW